MDKCCGSESSEGGPAWPLSAQAEVARLTVGEAGLRAGGPCFLEKPPETSGKEKTLPIFEEGSRAGPVLSILNK